MGTKQRTFEDSLDDMLEGEIPQASSDRGALLRVGWEYAHEKLGKAADYVLTSAVSLTAGVAAIASAFPALWAYRVPLALVILVVITVANLRGLRESGTIMTVPVYLFVGAFGAMLLAGIVAAVRDGPGMWAGLPTVGVPVTTFLLLHTFAAGCTALTGIEAISNGVTVFRPPVSRNASRALWVMAGLMVLLFLGSIGLTQY